MFVCIYVFLVALSSVTVNGELRFANYYHDHMVLQRAPQRAIVWGYTDTFTTPTVLTLNEKVYRTKSSPFLDNSLGESIWSVTLEPQTEEGPFQINVTQISNGTLANITLHDVLFGDVWVCSGQSNMELAVSQIFNGSIEIANAGKYPKIRLLIPAHVQSDVPVEEPHGVAVNWELASPETVGLIVTSAVCWLYGRMIHEGLDGRPIGLLHSSWGGTAIEFWSPPQALKDCGISSDSQVGFIGNNSVLYNGMIHPFTRMVIKGVIWYQGEDNINFHTDLYPCTFSKMIEYWRNIWHERTNSSTDPNFPFGFVQLSTRARNEEFIGGFPWIRWHQTFDVGYVPNNVVPNVFMATAMDLRDDTAPQTIHPRTKLDVGYRLSRSGLAVAYGQTNIPYQGPIIGDISVAADSHQINITYTNVASPSVELRNPSGFEVCCLGNQTCRSNATDWVVTPASTIKGAPLTIALTVPSSCVGKPIAGLRYLWRETPCLFKQAAIYSTLDSNLPAPPYIKFF